MSLLIEDEIFTLQKPANLVDKNWLKDQVHYGKRFMYQNQLNNKCFQTAEMCFFSQKNRSFVELVIPLRKRIFDQLDAWYFMRMNEDFICVDEKIVIYRHDMPYLVSPLKRKIEAIRQIYRGKQGHQKYVKLYIKSQGVIQMAIPKLVLKQNIANSFRANNKTSLKSLPFSTYFQNIVKFCLDDCKQTLKNIFKNLTDLHILEESSFRQMQRIQQSKAITFDLFKYLARSAIELRFDYSEGSAQYQQVVDITLTKEKQISERIKFMKEADRFQLEDLKLYLQLPLIFKGKQKQAFYVTAKEKQITKNLLEIPQIVPTKQCIGPNKSILENKYIFNNIVLQIPQKNQKLILLAQSGFGKIQYSTFSFWYSMGSKLDNQDVRDIFKANNKITNKNLVVKSPKPGEDRATIAKYRAKQVHELQIINKLKGISCVLIPRFYKIQKLHSDPFEQIDNQYSQKYENALLSQLAVCYGQPGYNLGDFIEEKWQSMTLKKIIFLMSQIAQALRFLHLNRIVHLDLKPQNVLLIKNSMIRLIDFGQAYHPQVSYKDSNPAYSYPYGCPQIVQQPQCFSDKSDVFSFGVMLYELIYGRDLISTNPSRLLADFRAKNYPKRLLFNIQELQSFGQDLILPMLNHLIIKALSADVQARPSITWISLLLKKYLEVLP